MRFRARGPSPLRLGPFSGVSVGGAEIMAALDAGASANLGCFKWLNRHSAMSEKYGVPISAACAKFEFVNDRVGEVRFAADVRAGIAGDRGTVTTFLADADIPATLLSGASASSEGYLDFPRNCLH